MKKILLWLRKKKSWQKRIWEFIRANVFISIFAAIILFVGVVVVFKVVTSEDEYVYTKINISQGLWWANTAKPDIWLAQGIQKGDVERSLTGKPIVEVLEVRRYPWWSSDEYQVYITAKIEVSKNDTTGKYSFKRSIIGVGSPIDLEFSTVQVSGTIMTLSETPYKNTTTPKTV
ncbi:MAG: hypothetical protein US54_C0071G0011, partial [Candidatus Roizmanbacteria bacterium GW2011_GWA2_37_7]